MSGLKKHFNADTMNGRANVAKATYASIAMLYLIYRIKRKKTPKQPEAVAAQEQIGVAHPSPDPKLSEAAPPNAPQQHERHFVAPPPPPPPPAQHNNDGDHDHAHDTHTQTEDAQTAITGADQQQQQQQQLDAHDKEKQHAADVLAGAISSHASKAATPSLHGGPCGSSGTNTD